MKRAIVIGALLATAGWFRTSIRNGNPIGQAPVEYDGKWHSGFIWGIVETSGPYDLQKVCPQGWSDIHTETTFLNGLVQAVTTVGINIYSPQTVTIRCSAAGGR